MFKIYCAVKGSAMDYKILDYWFNAEKAFNSIIQHYRKETLECATEIEKCKNSGFKTLAKFAIPSYRIDTEIIYTDKDIPKDINDMFFVVEKIVN